MGIKYGRRTRGTPNKATARLRESFTELLNANMAECKNSSIKLQKRALKRH
jgi:hypothetical protein